MPAKYHKDDLITESSPISAQLRSAGSALEIIGKAIEDSQVEDGDPPFQITQKQGDNLKYIASMLHRVQKSLTCDRETEDYGEDHLGERPGHEDE